MKRSRQDENHPLTDPFDTDEAGIIPNIDHEARRFGRWPAGTAHDVMSLHRTRLMWVWNAAPPGLPAVDEHAR